MKIRSILFGTVAAVAFAGSADAAHFHGWYVGVEGGANWVKDNNFKLSGNVGALESVEGGTAQESGIVGRRRANVVMLAA